MIKKIAGYISKLAGQIATGKTITNDWFPMFGLGNNTSGEVVTNSTALTLSTVFASVNCISQDVAKVPLFVYKRTSGGKEKLYNELTTLLHDRANPYTSAMDFRQTLTAHCLSWGNGYAEIQKDINGKIIALWILPPDRVRPIREEGKILYEIRSNGNLFYLNDWEVLHLKGLGFDGMQGYNIIQLAQQSLGSALAADKFSGAFFSNGANAGGYLEHPSNISQDAQKRLVQSIERRHLGASQAHRIMVLEEGMKFATNSIPPEQAQFIQTRQFSITDITRWFRIPAHKVSDLSKATFSNIEQQSLEYVTDTLSGWFKRWEQELWFKLLTEEERKSGYFVEHTVEGLLKGDIATRYSAYSTARNWGWLSVNDIRRLENLNDIPDGDQYLVPLNMTTPSKLEEATTSPTPPPSAPAPQEDNSSEEDTTQEEETAAAKLFIRDIAERISAAEIKGIEKQIMREDFDEDKFSEWATKFYKKHTTYIQKTIAPFSSLEDVSFLTLQKDLFEEKNKKEFLKNIRNKYNSTIERKLNELF